MVSKGKRKQVSFLLDGHNKEPQSRRSERSHREILGVADIKGNAPNENVKLAKRGILCKQQQTLTDSTRSKNNIQNSNMKVKNMTGTSNKVKISSKCQCATTHTNKSNVPKRQENTSGSVNKRFVSTVAQSKKVDAVGKVVCCSCKDLPLKKTRVKKELVRYSEVPQIPTVQSEPQVPLMIPPEIEEDEESEDEYVSPFETPEFLSSLRLAREIKDLKASISDRGPDKYFQHALQKIASTKAAKKLNIPIEASLYKNLISLQINDEDLHKTRRFKRTRKRDHHSPSPRDIEPKLSDYFTVSQGTEYANVNALDVFPVGSVRRYDGHSTYRRMQAW